MENDLGVVELTARSDFGLRYSISLNSCVFSDWFYGGVSLSFGFVIL